MSEQTTNNCDNLKRLEDMFICYIEGDDIPPNSEIFENGALDLIKHVLQNPDKSIDPEIIKEIIEVLEYASSYDHRDIKEFMEEHGSSMGAWTFQDELVRRIKTKSKNLLDKLKSKGVM